MSLVRLILWSTFALVSFAGISCTGDSREENVQSEKIQDETARSENTASGGFYSVFMVFSPHGLGDRGYSDNIYRGLREFEKEHSIGLDVYSPKSFKDAEVAIQSWFDEGRDSVLARFIKKRAMIVDGSYAPLFVKHREWKTTDYSTILMVDTRNVDSLDIYTRYVSLYGVSHWAGQIISKMGKKAAIVAANPNQSALRESIDGFSQGFRAAGGILDSSDIYYLDQNFGGFDQAVKAYRLSYDLDSAGYSFVFPVAGGSGDGVIRYTREYGDSSFYVCGMDVDKQAFSKQVAFSIVKRTDLVANEFLAGWLSNDTLAKDVQYGLSSRFVTVVVAKIFQQLHYNFASQMQKAISDEKEYMKW